jgi:hypothetical protein
MDNKNNNNHDHNDDDDIDDDHNVEHGSSQYHDKHGNYGIFFRDGSSVLRCTACALCHDRGHVTLVPL